MPPVARETCAFIGEIALVAWASRNDLPLAAQLTKVWRHENARYLGDDCDLLREALTDPATVYSYRMNYPLARAAAATLLRFDPSPTDLFSAGSRAMAMIPFRDIAELAARRVNTLPPVPPASPDETDLRTTYRALGTMVLLDMEDRKDEAERQIEGYYASLLNHLRHRTAYIGVDNLRRPIGYATWQDATDSGTLTQSRLVAPFGDDAFLRDLLGNHRLQMTPEKRSE